MSIIDKLKLNKYDNLAVLNQPSDYDVFNEYKTTLTGEHDAIFIFVETLDEMTEFIRKVIAENGCSKKDIYFSLILKRE